MKLFVKINPTRSRVVNGLLNLIVAKELEALSVERKEGEYVALNTKDVSQEFLKELKLAIDNNTQIEATIDESEYKGYTNKWLNEPQLSTNDIFASLIKD